MADGHDKKNILDQLDDEFNLDHKEVDTAKFDPLAEYDSPSSRLHQLQSAGWLSEAELEVLIEYHEQQADGTNSEETTEFGTVPVTKTAGEFDITILGAFPDADLSSLAFDHQLDGEKLERTVVLWDVFNKTDQRAKWGNSGVEYILDNRLQVRPDTEYTLNLDKVQGAWDRGPQAGAIPEIGANTRGRWFSVVDHGKPRRVVEAVLKGRQHREVTLELPESVFGDSENLPICG